MTRLLTHRLLACALALLALGASAQQPWRVYPPTPAAGEPFIVQYEGTTPGGPTTVRSATVSVQGSTLTYSVEITENDFSVPGAYRASSVVRGLAAGQYQVLLKRRGGFGGEFTSVLGTIQVAASQGPSQPAFRGLSGNWFDPGESGWGMNIVQGESGALFAVWLTYMPLPSFETVSRQTGMWLVMPEGRWVSPTQFRGLLYSTAGTTVAAPFDRTDLTVTPVGYVSLDFSGEMQAAMKAEAAMTQAAAAFGLYAPVTKEASIRRFQF